MTYLTAMTHQYSENWDAVAQMFTADDENNWDNPALDEESSPSYK